MKNQYYEDPERLRQAVIPLLSRVAKPARYIGKEIHAIGKPWDSVRTKVALVFPDIYDIGMSHVGMPILYSIVNDREEALCERVFAPWSDFESLMRERDIPLYSMESWRPLATFDIVGFTLQYELSYTNVLNMLDLGRIPLRSADRSDDDPVVIAGGPCAFNPEPIAPFFDAIAIGDGEETIVEIIDVCQRARDECTGRADLLRRLMRIEGVYVPSLYNAEYKDDRFVRLVPQDDDVPRTITKRCIDDLDSAPYPCYPVVPYIDVVHDRFAVEVMRGCERGCRFCHAGMIYRPRRERSPDKVLELLCAGVRATGHEDVSLTSLSTSDYSGLKEVVSAVCGGHLNRHVALSLPSLRADQFSTEIAEIIAGRRKTGLTFAPEAGTERLRRVINKELDEEKFMRCVLQLFRLGWRKVKLYFMVGLPTETEEDILGIISLARAVAAVGRKVHGRAARTHVSISAFIPKAHTPFQWEDFVGRAELQRRYDTLMKELRDRDIQLSWRDVEVAELEAVFARGDRRLSELVLAAWRHGAKFDAWSSEINWPAWERAWAESGMAPGQFTLGWLDRSRPLPWGHISTGVSDQFLWRDRERSQRGELWRCDGSMCTECFGCEYAKVQD